MKVQTEKVWGYANEYAAPVGLFINKLDRERADFGRTIEDIQKNFTDKTVLVIQTPVGKEEDFKGIIDLLSMKAYMTKAIFRAGLILSMFRLNTSMKRKSIERNSWRLPSRWMMKLWSGILMEMKSRIPRSSSV